MKKLSMLLLAGLVLFLLGMANLDEDEDYPWRNHRAPFDFMFGNMIDNHQQTRALPKGKKLQGFLYIHYTGETTAEGYPMAERADCDNNPDECRVGWVLKGIPVEATLVQKGPRLWLVDPDSLPKEPGYGHFQWVGTPKRPCGLEIGDKIEGFLLKRIAPAPFHWLGGQGGSGGNSGGHDDGGDCGDEAGCDGHDGSDGDCDGHDGSDGGCDGHDGGEGGCDGHDGGSDGDGGGSGGQGGSGGHDGQLVLEGVDPHRNIVTSWDGGGGHGGGGDCGDAGGCDVGHDGGDCGDAGGCDGSHDGDDCDDSGGCAASTASVSGAAPITIRINGDLNRDGQVDIIDLVLMASYLGSHDPSADLTGDGTVNIADLTMVARNID